MNIPQIDCKINAYCNVNPSEDPEKIKEAISNVLQDVEIKIDENTVEATSNDLESLSKIYETIHSRHSQKNYKRNLEKNQNKDSTWFYLNKQAAFADTIALCADADESPLGPIKVILKSRNIERIMEWLVSF